MLDKSLIYTGYLKDQSGRVSTFPSERFKVKILYEDSISFYVASLTEKDGKGQPRHFSVKKHRFVLKPVPKPDRLIKAGCVCSRCPYSKLNKGSENENNL